MPNLKRKYGGKKEVKGFLEVMSLEYVLAECGKTFCFVRKVQVTPGKKIKNARTNISNISRYILMELSIMIDL